ncbi:interferon lambda receptor 1 isoform X2 [Rhineura floridana]|uniref:interferon lambda receptor 1 isoform X2 n=1 Tax=Rhineura floridana TaxID=261503 RepID=UPI002AC81DBB|nr:interferon lambda receptor 1 isoform X2 [Rhineura floridana]
MSPLRVYGLLVLASFRQASGQEFLIPPPRNVMLVSKNFSLFLTWLPDASVPSGVSYTVQWMNPYSLQWNDVSHCRDISETACNITCVSTELNNRFSVQVKAQMKNSNRIASSAWVELKDIDYTIHVELAPPILQVRKTENALRVNATFSYPSCTKAILQDLTYYDLEFGANGAKKTRNYSEAMDNEVDIDTAHLSSGKYCLRARTFFSLAEKWSSFSEPICMLLHNKEEEKGTSENWAFVAVPLLLMFPVGAFVVFHRYKSMKKPVKMPRALDFSKGPTKLLEFGEMELIKAHPLMCTGAPVELGRRNRTGLQICSDLSPSMHSVSEDEEEEEEESGSPIPYTEMLRFQKKRINCQTVSVCQEGPRPSSGSWSFLPDLMVSEVPVSTGWVTVEADTCFQESKGISSSGSSCVEESLGFPVGCPAARGKGWNNVNGDIDFLSVLMGGSDINLPNGQQFTAARGHPEASCERLEDLKIPLFGILDNLDSCGLLLEEQFVDEGGSENDSSDCGSLVVEMPFLKMPCREALENGLQKEKGELGRDSPPETKFHGPKHTYYIART